MNDSTTRLLQILRTTLALVKYYEGHPDTAESMNDVKKAMQRAIDELALLEAAERISETDEGHDALDGIEVSELDWDRER
jgi:hypothetical protein